MNAHPAISHVIQTAQSNCSMAIASYLKNIKSRMETVSQTVSEHPVGSKQRN